MTDCPLTTRQVEVTQWLAEGKIAAEIADILGIAQQTVQRHILNARAICGAAKDTGLVAMALRKGWIT